MGQMFKNYICALDIGSSKLAAAAAEIRNRRILKIFFEHLPLRGIKKGVITDAIELVDVTGEALKNLKAKSGIPIKHIYTNFSGQNLIARHSHAVMPLAERGNKVITASDIQRVNEHARILGSNLEEEIIHAIPFGYTIDSKNNILNPIGLYSHKLEVDLYLLSAKVSHLQSLSHIVNQAGYEIKNVFFSGFACGKAIYNHKLSGNTDIICDIGGDTTELLLYRNGILRGIQILPVGGINLTSQLQKSLNIPFDLAEEIKITHGRIGDYSQISEDKEILIKKDSAYKPIKQKAITEIVTSQAQVICRQIKDGIDKLAPSGEINNFIVAGRAALLEGFLESLEGSLGMALKFARIANPDITPAVNKDDAVAGQKYLGLLGVLGILAQAFSSQYAPAQAPASKPGRNIFLKTMDKVKEVYQEYF